MTRSKLSTLKGQLIERDYQLLHSVNKYRLLTTRQVQRLHFDRAHQTPLAAARACVRALNRLHDHGVLKRLERRIGGVRAGSASFVWYVGPAGERILQSLALSDQSGRRNYREPSRHFVEHTLAIAELAVATIEAARSGAPGSLEVLELQTEPASWQESLSKLGTLQTLKPDLRLVTATTDEDGEYEHHWFIEADLATEHLPVIVRQCTAYIAFRATGRYQAEHGLFPIVVWVVPDARRRNAIWVRLGAEKRIDERLFTVITVDDFVPLLSSGANAFNTAGSASSSSTDKPRQKAETPS